MLPFTFDYMHWVAVYYHLQAARVAMSNCSRGYGTLACVGDGILAYIVLHLHNSSAIRPRLSQQ